MKYPIGIQSFERIIKEGYVYVDKTDLIYQIRVVILRLKAMLVRWKLICLISLTMR